MDATTSKRAQAAYPTGLPGLREYAETLPPAQAPWEEYVRRLVAAWRALVTSTAGRTEHHLQRFLEAHPCLLPGFRSMTGTSGHYPYPAAVISQPKLPGLSTRRPDFCWLATDSQSLYVVLIEIETPDKQWFRHDAARYGEPHRDFVHARGQLDRWKAWFRKPDNQIAFVRQYRIPEWPFYSRELVPQYVLVHGSRGEFINHPDLPVLC